MDWFSGRMGGGVSGVRFGRAVGRAFASGTVAAGRSKGIGVRKRTTAVRALASGKVGVWDGSGKPFICGSSGVWDSRRDRDGEPFVLVLIVQHGQRCRGQKRGAWWRQL